jgi:hypothetical protein
MESLEKIIHHNGEHKMKEESAISKPILLDTFSGLVHVEWDSQVAVSTIGQMPFFTEFLKTSGVFDNWINDCPLSYFSNNASKKRDILGTLLLSVLSGYTRYAHISALRNDGVNPPMLGMGKVVSEDTARRAVKRIKPSAGIAWLEKHLSKSYKPLLETPWIMDVDSTIKTLYGKQEGAKVGYNPTKPERPSHTYHTYLIANIRMILDVEVEDGKSGAGYYSAPKLWQFIDALPSKSRPAFIRGDASYGNETIIKEAEARELKYLFKLRCTPTVKQLITQMMETPGWKPAGKGWEGNNSELQLSSWAMPRRVVLLRKRVLKSKIVVTKKTKNPQQLNIFFLEATANSTPYEYQTLVTNLEDSIATIAQHYRDRADCENNFDELKNQWGWCGYTTKDLKNNPCRANQNYRYKHTQ